YVVEDGPYDTGFRFSVPSTVLGDVQGLLYFFDSEGKALTLTLSTISQQGIHHPTKRTSSIHPIILSHANPQLLKSPTQTTKTDACNIGWARFDSLAPISAEAIISMPTQLPLTKPLILDEPGVFPAKDFTIGVNSASQTLVIVNPGIHPLTL